MCEVNYSVAQCFLQEDYSQSYGSHSIVNTVDSTCAAQSVEDHIHLKMFFFSLLLKITVLPHEITEKLLNLVFHGECF